MSACLIDTSVAGLMLNDRPALVPYQYHLVGAQIHVSFQTVAEMRFGALLKNWGADKITNLEAFLASVLVVGYSDPLGHCWAHIMRESRTLGRRLEAADAWIAATALLLNAPLLTHDKDFSADACPSITVVRYSR